jgi:hypothetical protein
VPPEEFRFCTVLAVKSVPGDGTAAASAGIVADTAALLNMVSLQLGGEEFRTVNDVCFYAFPRADDALRAASEMHRETQCQQEITGQNVALRIGLDSGDVERIGGLWQGEPLQRSARLCSLAPLGSTLAAEGLYSYLARKLREQLRPFPVDEANGRRLGTKVYELPWREQEEENRQTSSTRLDLLESGTLTMPLSGSGRPRTPNALDVATARQRLPLPTGMTEREADSRPPVNLRPSPPDEPRLCLIRGQRLIVVDARTPQASLGRSDENDIQIDIETASRRHADIAYSGGRFLLTDHSWNGTYVYDAKGNGQLVHNDHLELPEEGYVCPGTPEASEQTSFRFRRADAPRTHPPEE